MSPVASLVLVDGSNVARCASWRAAVAPGLVDDVDVRRRLVDAVCSWAAGTEHEVVMAFDGAGPWQAGVTRVTPHVEVEGSGAREGDAVLEHRANAARRAGRPYWLVTSDRAIQQVAGHGADRVLDADAFVGELDAPKRIASLEPSSSNDTSHATRLADSVDGAVLSKLERMRRGEP